MIYSRFRISILSLIACIYSSICFSQQDAIPSLVRDFYDSLSTGNSFNMKSPFKIKQLNNLGLKKVKRIPTFLLIKNINPIDILKSDKFYIIQFEPSRSFFLDSSRLDLKIWDILWAQAAELKHHQQLSGGFFNVKASTVFYNELLHEENGRLKRALYCICVYKKSIIEVVYSEDLFQLVSKN